MYCPKCGKENIEGAQLCGSCSWVLTSTSTSPAPDAKTSSSAIAALVLGILAPFTLFLTTLPAIICGIVALVKINKSRGQLKGNGLAIAGISIPVVVLPIVAMLLAILMPALARVRMVAYRQICATNMNGIGKAMILYANDYKEMYPTPSKWCDLLVMHYDVSPMQLKCKGAHNDGRSNYAMNKNIEKLSAAAPPDIVLLFETGPGWNQSGGPELLSTKNHCGDGCNVLFVDGHIEFVRTKDLSNLKWTPDAKK